MDLYDRLTHDRTECFAHLLGTVGIFLPKETFGIERITGRKSRSLQMEEIGCKCQTFFSLSLKQQEEKNYKCQIFGFPDSSVGK